LVVVVGFWFVRRPRRPMRPIRAPASALVAARRPPTKKHLRGMQLDHTLRHFSAMVGEGVTERCDVVGVNGADRVVGSHEVVGEIGIYRHPSF
jgi:hypothetical protein